MVQYSDDIRDLFGAPELSLLTVCGAKALPELPDLLSSAIWSYISGLTHPNSSVLHLDLAFLRRANAAAEEYRSARSLLSRYVEGLTLGEHRLKSYLSALTHFEQCVGATWQAAELFHRMEQKVLGEGSNKLRLYKKGEDTDLERLNCLNNVAKHFSVAQAERSSTPVWITNEGLKCETAFVSFGELLDNVVALSKVAEETFIEIPKLAQLRRDARAADSDR